MRDSHKGHGHKNDVRIAPERGHHAMIEIENIVHQVDVAQLQENDAEIGIEDQGTDHGREDAVGLKTDHDEADLGTGNHDIIANHLDVNIFLI